MPYFSSKKKSLSIVHRIFLCLMLLSFLTYLFLSIHVSAASAESTVVPETLKNLHARAALLMDGSNQRILFEKNGETELPMASTTKIMTCLYALEHGNLTDQVTFSARAASAPKTDLGTAEGASFLLSDLLYALMLESCNDAAIAIAEHISGSVEAFCKEMTQEARDYGCYHTSFATPNGLDAANHYTTCRDLAVLTCLALQNENFRKIIRESSFTIKELKSGRAYSLRNKNAFLSSYEGAIGVKTGYTGNAGYCFVGAIKKEDRLLISVVLGSGSYPNRGYKWTDTKKLMDYGLSSYKKKNILLNQGLPSALPVTGGRTASCAVSAPKSASLYLSNTEKTACTVTLPKTLSAPVKKGDAVGSVTLRIDGTAYRTWPVCAAESIKRRTFSWCYKKVTEQWLEKFCLR